MFFTVNYNFIIAIPWEIYLWKNMFFSYSLIYISKNATIYNSHNKEVTFMI